jgi:Secretion system C-terminal sorting domain
MKKLHYFFVLLLFPLGMHAQTDRPLPELLALLSENHIGAITDVFTEGEIRLLHDELAIHSGAQNGNTHMINRRIQSTQGVTPVTAVEIDPSNLSVQEILANSPLNEFEGAGWVRGIPANGAVIIDNINQVHTRGIASGNYNKVGVLSGIPAGHSVTGVELMSDDTMVYAISTSGSSSTLSMINTTTWEATPIGSNSLVLPIALGRNASDELFTVDIDDDNLYRLNTSTGAATLVGPIGFDANFGQGMFYDKFQDKLYMTAFNNTLFDSELREFDTSTGLSVSLGTIFPSTTTQYGWSALYDKDLLGIINIDANEWILSPNPVRDAFQVQASQLIERVTVYSIYGQKLLEVTIDDFSGNIDMAYFPSGSYLIQLTSQNSSSTQKLIKL